MSDLGPVPYNSRDAAFANNFSATLLNSAALFQRFRLVISGQRFCSPKVRVFGMLNSENDGRVANVADVDLAAADEGNAGRCAGSAGKARCRFGPIFCKRKRTVSKNKFAFA